MRIFLLQLSCICNRVAIVNEPRTSLRAPVPGRTGPSPHEVIAGRLHSVRELYIALVPDAAIVAKLALEWRITRRSTRRYLVLVKARFAREHAAAESAERERLQNVVVANLQRQLDTERRAREHTDADGNATPDFKAEVASQRGQLLAVERLCTMLGLDSPRKVEHSTAADAVAKMTPAERRTRALAALKRQLETATGEGETH